MSTGEDGVSDRRDGGSGSCSSSKEIIPQRDDFTAAAAAASGAVSIAGGAIIPTYTGIDIHQLKADHFSYLPFISKSFDEASVNIGQASIVREAVEAQVRAGTCEGRDMGLHHMTHERDIAQHHVTHEHHHHTHQIATATAFHISRPSHSISTIISPPPLHHTSIILDQDHSFHVPRIILPNENFQQQQEQPQQHHKLGGRSASGLEELIMGCSSTDIKEESSVANQQEPEWLKYSTFWPDPDNPDHHG